MATTTLSAVSAPAEVAISQPRPKGVTRRTVTLQRTGAAKERAYFSKNATTSVPVMKPSGSAPR